MMTHKYLSAATFVCAFAVDGMVNPAFADGTIVGLMSDADKRVLEQFETRRDAAIAKIAPNAPVVAMVREVLGGDTLPFDDGYDPTGDWRCRYIKLGGESGRMVYAWFSCRIFEDGAGWVIQKSGGSQRTMGRLYRLSAARLLYLGALHYSFEEPIWFGDDPSRNQIAVLTRLDDGRMRLEFPEPLFDSRFDILEFVP